MLSLRRLSKGVLKFTAAEFGSHKCLKVANGSQSRGRTFPRGYSMRMAPRPKPKSVPVRKDEYRRRPRPVEEYLPSVDILKAAYKVGVLNIEPEVALRILRQHDGLRQSGISQWAKKFIQDENITPETLNTLALIMIRTANPAGQLLARHLMHTASFAGDANATIFLGNTALRQRRLDDRAYSQVLERINAIATSPNPHPAILLLLGRIHEQRSKLLAALQCFRQAVSIASKSEDPTHQAVTGDALVAQGVLLDEQKDHKAAAEAFRRAALDFDSPRGYYLLAGTRNLPGSNVETYLLKAASSGVTEAAARLGVFYEQKSQPLQHVLPLKEDVANFHQAVKQGNDEMRKTSNEEPGLSANDRDKHIAKQMSNEWLILAREAAL